MRKKIVLTSYVSRITHFIHVPPLWGFKGLTWFTYYALRIKFHLSRMGHASNGLILSIAMERPLVSLLLVYDIDQRFAVNVVVQVFDKQIHGTLANIL